MVCCLVFDFFWRNFQVWRIVLKLEHGSGWVLNIEITQLGLLCFKIHSHLLGIQDKKNN
jgi:hypothetical protein